MGKIFCIGLNKTGTTSLCFALIRLGYRCLHDNRITTNEKIRRAIEDNKPLFHYFREDYDAYSDIFELTRHFDLADQQYPDSRFILTTRNLESWLDSRKRHVERNILRKAQGKYSGTWLKVDIHAWSQEWESHQGKITSHFARQMHKLLTLNICEGEGYERLCPFLGKEGFSEPFPRKNHDRQEVFYKTYKSQVGRSTVRSRQEGTGQKVARETITSFPIYRIRSDQIRSQRAFESWSDLPVIDVPAVKPTASDDLRSRERACSQAHANALKHFLSTSSSHCIITEDDSILTSKEWLSYGDYDYFLPFSEIRDQTPANKLVIRSGILPLWGTQSYLASRRFAIAYIPLLESGGIADHVNVVAAIGLRVGSSANNGIIHDIDVPSIISEQRRSWLLKMRHLGGSLPRQTKRVPERAHSVSFCIVCRGRRHHLEQTVEENLKETKNKDAEIVLLDYQSEDGLADWICDKFEQPLNSGQLQFFQIQESLPFSIAVGKNFAHRLARMQIIINLDPDNFIGDLWAAAQGLNATEFLTCEKGGGGILGRIGFWRDHFQKLNGYNENIEKGGSDHIDLKQRALKMGLTPRDWPCNLLPIRINNNEIVAFRGRGEKYPLLPIRTRDIFQSRNHANQRELQASVPRLSSVSFRHNFKYLVTLSLGSDCSQSKRRSVSDSFFGIYRPMKSSTPIYRIWPGYIRSQRAFDTWREYPVIDVPAVKTNSSDLYWRERACSESHANVLRLFLSTQSNLCVVIEDDVILLDRSWLDFKEFDYFVPFINHRDENIGTDFKVLHGSLPKYGNQAAVVSRRFAKAYLPFLEAGEIADHANRRISGMRVGCYTSNGVLHDIRVPSIISEARRLSFLTKPLPTVFVTPPR